MGHLLGDIAWRSSAVVGVIWRSNGRWPANPMEPGRVSTFARQIYGAFRLGLCDPSPVMTAEAPSAADQRYRRRIRRFYTPPILSEAREKVVQRHFEAVYQLANSLAMHGHERRIVSRLWV